MLIFDSEENEIEAVQVKALKNNVTLSRLGHDKPDGFFTRQAIALKRNPTLKVTLASFGPVGPELKAALDGEAKQLANHVELIAQHNYVSKEDASTVLQATTDSIQEEAQLKKDVREWLERSLTGIDPDKALAVLQTWIRICAESGLRVRYEDLISEVESIGKFLREAAAHNLEWGVTIHPIEVVPISDQRRAELAEGFYQGLSVQYEHILAELDVERPKVLSDINSKFTASRVVVVKAASGQGKSAVAYRFIHNYASARLCYQVQATEDLLRAGQIALAMSSHVANIDLPTLVYVDVRPTDYAWREIILRLAKHENVQVLITIREEDWTRGALSKAELDHTVIEVEFSEDEANLIYEMLRGKHLIADTVNFEDAWNRFGREGQLIEFVHFISQGESLYDRLKGQIQKLKEDVQLGKLDTKELRLLRLVAIATAFEARIKTRSIAEFLELPEPQGTIARFEKEYLLRTNSDGSLITSLHPIRSMALVELLTDASLDPWVENAAYCLDLIAESDLANFLLYAFSRSSQYDPAKLLEKLNHTNPGSWTIAIAIVRALLWYGIKWFVDDNRTLFNRAYDEVGQSMTVAINLDITNAIPEAFEGFQKLILSVAHEEGRKQIESYQQELSGKEVVFKPLLDWLNARTAPLPIPIEQLEWLEFAEIALWAGWSKGSLTLLSNVDANELWRGIEILPLDQAARLLYCAYCSLKRQVEDMLDSKRETIVERLRRDLKILKLEDEGTILSIHFIMPLFESVKEEGVKDVMNYHAMKRIDIIRNMLPDRAKYYTIGYGHKFAAPLDTTVKNINVENLPIEWITAPNAQCMELIIREYRPDSWKIFGLYIISIRKDIVSTLDKLLIIIKKYFQTTVKAPLLGKHIDDARWSGFSKLLNSPPLLPKQAGDEWGFVRLSDSRLESKIEQIANDNASSTAIPPLAFGAFRSSPLYLKFWKVYKSIFSSYSTFFQKGAEVLILSPVLGRNVKTAEDKEKLDEYAKSWKIDQNAKFSSLRALYDIQQQLSVFQGEFRSMFANWIDETDLGSLEKEEQRLFDELWHYWHVFAFHPEARGVGEVIKQRRWREQVFVRVMDRFEKKLSKIENNIVKLVKPSEGPALDGKPAFWAVVSVDSINGLIEGGVHNTAIASAMAKAKIEESIGSLDSYVYEDQCEKLVIVPLIKGRSLEWLVWVFDMNGTSTEEEVQSPQLTQKICPIIEDMEIVKWDNSFVDILWQLRRSAADLIVILAHLFEVISIDVADGDEVAQKIVDDYSSEISPMLQNAFDRIHEVVTSLTQMLSSELSIEDLKGRSGFVEAMRLVPKVFELIYPPNQEDGKTLSLRKEGMEQWVTALSQASKYIDLQIEWVIEGEFESLHTN